MLQPLRSQHLVLVAAASLMLTGVQAQAASITVQSRTSSALVNTFAGSNGATRSDTGSLTETATLGAFNFGDTAMASVETSDQFSDGQARSEATISVSDSVLQAGSTLNVTASKTSQVSALSIIAPSSATVRARYNLTVEFRVEGSDFNYSLNGLLDPGDTGVTNANAGRVTLQRPFGAGTLFTTNLEGPYSKTGVLTEGRTYQLLIRTTDDYSVGNGGGSADESSVSLFFTASPVPEPGSLALLGLGGLLVGRRRRI